jgi:DNA polymerase V
MLTLPLALEAVHAGFPSVAQDYFISDFSFDEHIITHPDTSFVVRVAGDSMIGAGIYDGDLLIVDRALEPKDSDVVIAAVNDELTVKRLHTRKNLPPLLVPENPRYPTIPINEDTELTIWGVAIGNYHFLHPLDSTSSAMGAAI